MEPDEKLWFDLEIRLLALEAVVTQGIAMSLAAAGVSPASVMQSARHARLTLLAETFEGADPALADHASAAIADRAEGLLMRISRRMAEGSSL